MPKRQAEEPYKPDKRKHGSADDVLITIQQRYVANSNQDEAFQSKLNLTLNAIDNANFAATIKSSTDGISALISKHLDLLYCRSVAYYQVGQFSKGISDAQTMIQLDPTQALGYLRAGQLFSANGNQVRALEIYRSGLAIVRGEHREWLEYECQQAMAKLQRRVNIIARAPYEILMHILSYLHGYEIIKMLGVCKEWQKRLSDPPELWSTLVIGVNRPEWFHMDFVYHHVVDLDLYCSKHGIYNQAMAQIALGKFIQLRTLAITKCNITPIRDLLYALNAVSNTLVEITITPNESDGAIKFKTIIATCPRLEKFHYNHDYVDRSPNFGAIPRDYKSSITSLDLYIPGLREADVEETLRACPNLRSVCLGHGHGPFTMTTSQLIRRYCVKLDTLWMSVSRHAHSFKRKEPTQLSAGIRNLGLDVAGSPTSASVLKENSETVEEFALFMPERYGTLFVFNDIPPMAKLRSLHISHRSDPTKVATKILAQAPGLEHLLFTSCHLRNPDIFKSLGQLDCLKELEFTDVRTGEPDGIHTLLRILAGRGTIQKIAFRNCVYLNDSLLSILPTIQSLLHITVICGNVCFLTEQGMYDFCKRLQTHSVVSSLNLGNMDCVTDTTLRLLSAIPHLTTLRLALLSRCTSRGLQYFNHGVNVVTATNVLSIW